MFCLGLDLGQKRDHSAIAVVEREDSQRAYQGPVFRQLLVRHVERVPLGTPYPEVVEGVRRVLGLEELARRCSVAVDATGVGAPVVDLLKSARLGCHLMPVTISGGDREHCTNGVWSVPKRDLIAGVEVLLEKGQLKIARGLRDTGSLVRELMDVRATARGPAGRVRYGADGCGEHDDLVIALALACWGAMRPRNSFESGRLLW